MFLLKQLSDKNASFERAIQSCFSLPTYLTHTVIAMSEPTPEQVPVPAAEAPPTEAKTSKPTPSTPPNPHCSSSAAQETVEEPQNALTKKFSDAEWKALKEFRVCTIGGIYYRA